jgi:hypothetical protein
MVETAVPPPEMMAGMTLSRRLSSEKAIILQRLFYSSDKVKTEPTSDDTSPEA